MEGALHRHYEDYIEGKEINFIPMPQALKKTKCRSGGGERMGKIRECKRGS